MPSTRSRWRILSARRVLAGFVEVLIGLGVVAHSPTKRPVGAHQHPTTGGDAAVHRLESLDVGHCHQVVGVLQRLRVAVDHVGRCDEVLHRNRVHCIVRQVAARDPVDRRVEVRAGVFAAGKIVPVPAGATLVVARHLLDAERPALAHFGRQRDLRKFGRERLRQVDHADATGVERAREGGEELGGGHGSPVRVDPGPRVEHGAAFRRGDRVGIRHGLILPPRVRVPAPSGCRASAPATPAPRRRGRRLRHRRAALSRPRWRVRRG